MADGARKVCFGSPAATAAEEGARRHDLRLELGRTKLGAEYDAKHRHHAITVESRMLFDPLTTQAEEVSLLVRATAGDADRIEAHFFPDDADSSVWLTDRGTR